MSFVEYIVDVIFPKRCVGCKRRGGIMCVSCTQTLLPASIPPEQFITSIFAYHNPEIRTLVRMLKYKNAKYVAEFFAPYMLEALTEFLGEEKLFHGDVPILLVPVPLSKKRRRARGYNQSELLIKAMLRHSENSRLVLESTLVTKTKDTRPQAEIKKRSIRLLNQNDCFAVLPHKRTGSEVVIVIDDVTTTGATLASLKDKLLEAGFKKVFALTVAH